MTRACPPTSSIGQGVTVGSAAALPYPGTQRVVVYVPGPAELAEPGPFVQKVTTSVDEVPAAGAELLGIRGDLDQLHREHAARSAASCWPRRHRSTPSATRCATTRALLWVIGPTLVALVAGLAWLLAGRALRPVHAVTPGSPPSRPVRCTSGCPSRPSSDEIAELARTMNGMLGRLEAATAASRQLVADASHELRTPVGRDAHRARGGAAGAGAGLAGDDRRADRRARPPAGSGRRSAVAGADRRGHRRARPRLRRRRVDGRSRARRRDRVRVGFLSTSPSCPSVVPPVVGDEAALRRAVDHLVANAARHADGQVWVALSSGAGEVTVDVDDDGPGIAPAHRAVVRATLRTPRRGPRPATGAVPGSASRSAARWRRSTGATCVIGDAPLGGARVSIVVPVVPRAGAFSGRGVATSTGPRPRRGDRSGGRSRRRARGRTSGGSG